MYDSPKLLGLRKELINNLIKKGINNKNILEAFLKVPRHLFIHKDFESFAYKDEAFPIDENQTISQPFTVAFQTHLLNVKKGDKILEIGTGSGFQSAVLVFLGADVYTIERNHSLFRSTSKLFKKLNINPIKFKYGDGYEGLIDDSPFDGIIVTAGSPSVPENLLKQLKIGGRMVIPIGKDTQVMNKITRISINDFKKETFGYFKFVPMLDKKD